MHPFFQKITAAHLMMGWGRGSKWKEGNSFFFKVTWSCTGHLNDAPEKGSPPTCALTPGLLPSAFSSTAERSQQPISSTCGHQLLPWPPALADEWHSPFCIPRLYAWNEGNPGFTVELAHASTRMQLVRSSIPLLRGTLLGACLVVCNPSTQQESQHTTGKLRKAKQIKRPQEADRIRE